MTIALLLFGCGIVVLGLILVARYLDAKAWRQSLLAIELRLPIGLTTDDISRWLNTVAAASHTSRFELLSHPPLVVEVVATETGIRHLLLLPKQLRATVLGGLRAALPGVRIEERAGYLTERPNPTVAVEATLDSQQRQMAISRAEITATAILATLQPLDPGETIVVQWIFTGAGTPEPVPSMAGRSEELPTWLAGEELADSDAIRAARQKQTDALLHVSLRIGVQAASPGKATAILGRVWGQHRGQNSPGVRLSSRWWLGRKRSAFRLSELSIPVTTWPLLMSTREAAGLLPMPLGDVALPGLALGIARQLPPPPGMPKDGVQIGVSNYPDMCDPLRLAGLERLQHLHVVGPTGTGKSTLLANLILQDISAGHGVVVIDPKSDLVADVLARIPDHRAADVIVADAASTDHPIGFNILRAAHDEQSRELVVDHVIHIWHELYKDFWGPRSEDVLRGALLSLINTKAANGEAFTLIETPTLLTDTPLRKFVTEQEGVPAGLDSFWHWYRGIMPMDRLKVIGPILNKLRAATLRTPIRLMLGQSDGLDLDNVIAERKILLVPLSAGTLGAETAGLLGTLLLAALWQAILGRIAISASERHPFYVFIDEAQSVLKLPVDLADMLAQARGLGAGFILAHQHLGQIEDKQVLSALLGTVRSQIVMQTMRADAVTLAASYQPRLTADDLMNLAKFEFAARLCVDGQTLAPLTGTTLPLLPPTRDGAALARVSRERFGRARVDVDAALKVRNRAPESDGEGNVDGPDKQKTFGRRRKPAGGKGDTA